MLLKAGMTWKQALFYNLLSSVLALLGMGAGILMGTVSSITPWVFSATAGIFLYVALVDMAPELSTGLTHPLSQERQGGQWASLALQTAGTILSSSEIPSVL